MTSQAGPLVQFVAGVLAIIPMAALAAWMYIIRDSTPGVAEFFLGPLLVGGAIIFWLLFLHLVMCRDSLAALGFRISGFWRDVATGLVLGLAFLLLKYLTGPFLRGLFEPRPPSAEIITLIHSVASDPLLLALWLGPVVWIGIAGFEELWRVVVLRRFWIVFPGVSGKWIVLLLVSVLIGASPRLPGASCHCVDFSQVGFDGRLLHGHWPRPATDRGPRRVRLSADRNGGDCDTKYGVSTHWGHSGPQKLKRPDCVRLVL